MNSIIIETPVGYLEIIESNNKIIKITFTDSKKTISSENRILNKCKTQLIEYFEGTRKQFDIETEINGTDFQKKVWSELYHVPYGKTMSYKELAEKIDSPKSFRAVANALHVNPLPIIYPCHRIIGSSGKMVGYAPGVDKKEFLLKLEKL